MKMRKLLALLMVATSTFTFAQEISISGGISKIDERVEGEQLDHNYGLLFKFNYVQWIPLSDARFSINPGFSAGFYETKLEVSEEKLLLSYLSLPVELVYRVKPVGSSFFVYGGGYFSLLVQAETEQGELKINDGDYSYKSTDYGINLGVGYAFENGLILRAGYTKGLANILNYPSGTSDSYIKNSSFALSIGYVLFKKRI